MRYKVNCESGGKIAVCDMPKVKPESPERSAAAIGQRLLRVRQLHDVNQTEFVKEIGAKQNTYSAYESGARKCSVELANALCDRYALTLDYIFRGEHETLPLPLLREFREKGLKP